MLTRIPFLTATLSAVMLAGAISEARAQETINGQSSVSVSTDRFVVAGEVTARSETGFTLLTKRSELMTVQVGRDTAIVKGAQTITLTEIKVGDKVSVTLRRTGDGSLQAVDVAVQTGFEPKL